MLEESGLEEIIELRPSDSRRLARKASAASRIPAILLAARRAGGRGISVALSTGPVNVVLRDSPSQTLKLLSLPAETVLEESVVKLAPAAEE